MATEHPRDVLTRAAAARGDSLSALSTMLGRNAAYLQQFVRRGTPRLLAERDRAMLAAYLGVAETALGGPDAPAPPIRVPSLDIAASAGPGSLVDREVALGTNLIAPDLARRLGLRDGQAAIVRVRGDSMAPGLLDGDHIVVDRADRVPPGRGGLYVVHIDGAVMVKRVARTGAGLRATSDNPDAAPVPPGAIHVIGRVVWQMRAPG